MTEAKRMFGKRFEGSKSLFGTIQKAAVPFLV